MCYVYIVTKCFLLCGSNYLFLKIELNLNEKGRREEKLQHCSKNDKNRRAENEDKPSFGKMVHI